MRIRRRFFGRCPAVVGAAAARQDIEPAVGGRGVAKGTGAVPCADVRSGTWPAGAGVHRGEDVGCGPASSLRSRCTCSLLHPYRSGEMSLWVLTAAAYARRRSYGRSRAYPQVTGDARIRWAAPPKRHRGLTVGNLRTRSRSSASASTGGWRVKELPDRRERVVCGEVSAGQPAPVSASLDRRD